jgi:hypothetical protein
MSASWQPVSSLRDNARGIELDFNSRSNSSLMGWQDREIYDETVLVETLCHKNLLNSILPAQALRSLTRELTIEQFASRPKRQARLDAGKLCCSHTMPDGDPREGLARRACAEHRPLLNRTFHLLIALHNSHASETNFVSSNHIESVYDSVGVSNQSRIFRCRGTGVCIARQGPESFRAADESRTYLRDSFANPGYETSWYKSIEADRVENDVAVARVIPSEHASGISSAVPGFVYDKTQSHSLGSVRIVGAKTKCL